MNTNLFIPKKINVGYQKRTDTYTGNLAYIIYWDDKGKLRKETSWNGWRDNKIDNTEIDNIPTEGFVLNKGVGGARQSYGYNARNEYIRVYDPRGFEFEISVANLLFILQECTSSKGKGLEGEFVYSWSGKELVLLPLTSQEYKTSAEYTSLQKKKVTRKDMLAGCSYTTKDNKELIYLGRFDYHDFTYSRGNNYGSQSKKCHVFIDEGIEIKKDYQSKYVQHTGFTKLAVRTSQEPVHNYSDLLEEFHNSRHGSAPVKLDITPCKVTNFDVSKSDYIYNRNLVGNFFTKTPNGVMQNNIREDWSGYGDDATFKGYCVDRQYRYLFNNEGRLIRQYESRNYYDKKVIYTKEDIENMIFNDVLVEMESGSKVKLNKFGR
tara:strand:+ start:142540 stop:143673 length:1134 start_codon:yes stop_codon:yes gene_type:complete